MEYRVLLWSVKLHKEEPKKVVKPWPRHCKVTGRIDLFGYELKSEVGYKTVGVLAHCLLKIPKGVIETTELDDGMLLDSVRTLSRIPGTKVRKNKVTGHSERNFKITIRGSRSSC